MFHGDSPNYLLLVNYSLVNWEEQANPRRRFLLT